MIRNGIENKIQLETINVNKQLQIREEGLNKNKIKLKSLYKFLHG